MQMDISKKLLSLLKEKKLTQKELSQKSGITEAAISRYIKGDRIPRGNNLKLLASALNVTTDDLFEDSCFDTKNPTKDIELAKTLIARNANNLNDSDLFSLIDFLMSQRGKKNNA